MAKTRIFYLITSLNVGGTEKFLSTLAVNLKNEYDITIGYLKEKGSIGKTLETNGYTLIHCPNILSLINYLKSNCFSLVHTFLYRANIIGRIAAKIAHIPVIIGTQQSIDIWKGFLGFLLDKYTANLCTKIITNSEAARTRLLEKENVSDEKIDVVYNGINHEIFQTKRCKEEIEKDLWMESPEPIIISVMRLHKEKGADFIPEIANNVRKGIFLIVGDGPERSRMEKKIEKYNLSERFVFLGWQNDVSELLSIASVFLMPSREESFPQSILEAMTMKLPVIASDVGGVRELIENNKNGILIKPKNINEFSKAVNYLVLNPENAKRMGENGYEKSKVFTEKRMINSIKNIYNTCLNRSSHV